MVNEGRRMREITWLWAEVEVTRRRLLLEGRVVEELLDEVDVTEEHPAAAVALQAQGVQSVTREKHDAIGE